ncbi:MAG: hypothetical protein JO126_07355 [Alphaproteobacteria bacterium]|nr:hypothetical protein [Alphaproteobacteria bacterium]MBV8549257.1 hypothetical protein [Alphaproteobacteria bacterium]
MNNANNIFAAALLQDDINRSKSRMPGFTFLVGCLLILLIHAQLVTWAGPVGLVWLFFSTALLLFTSHLAALTLLLAALLLQNTVIAMVAPQITEHSIFSILQATSFLITLICACLALPVWLRMHDYLKREYKPLLRSMIWLVVVIAVYCVYGLAHTDASSAVTYARTFLSGALMLTVGIVFGLQVSPRQAAHITSVFAIVMIAWGFAELLVPRELYTMFNAADFLHLKFAGASDILAFSQVSDVLNFEKHSYLNLSGIFGLDLVTLRLRGPSFHPITFAYSAAFCCLLCFIYREDLLALGCYLVVLLIGAKGALLLTTLSAVLYLFYKITRNPGWYKIALVTALLFYVVIALFYGSATRDYHFVGLMGGIKGFLHNPLGYGVGVGGNLSEQGKQDLVTKMSTIQNVGGDYGFESGVGVGLYQLGIGFTAIIAFFYQMWRQVWYVAQEHNDNPRLMIIPSVYAILLANSLFQEEAFSPVGWGLWFLFGGMLIANRWREHGVIKSHEVSHDKYAIPKTR